jgi:hypothetical protein
MCARSKVPSGKKAALARPAGSFLRRFFVREDPVYRRYERAYQAKSTSSKIIYLMLYLIPGLIVYAAINVKPVYRVQLALTHLPATTLQYLWVLLFANMWLAFGAG